MKIGAELARKAHATLPHLYDGVDKHELIDARGVFEILIKRRQVERGLLAFIEQAARFTWQPREFKRRLIGEFYRQIRERLGVYDRPTDSSRCNDRCDTDYCCICLSRDFELYGCIRHGTIHECATNAKRDSTNGANNNVKCTCTRVTPQTEVVCVFSGKVVDKYLMEDGGGSKDFGSSDMHVSAQAGFQFRMSMLQREAVVDHYENRSSPSHPIFDLLADPHFDEDKPIDLNARGRKAKRRAAPEMTVEKRARLNDNNYFEFRKVQIVEEAERHLRSIADDVINHILFDEEVRRLLNEEQIFRISSESRYSLEQYHAAKKRAFEMPVWTECIAAFYTPHLQLKLLRIVAYDREQVAKFCDFAVSRWKLCFSSPAIAERSVEPCTFKRFALALLFAMRSGLSIPARGSVWTETDAHERISVIPRDSTLSVDLPDENLLKFFGRQAREALRATLAKGATASTTTQQASKATTARGPRIERVPQRLEINGVGTVMCRSFLPAWLHEEVLGDTTSYAPSDITVGLDFFKNCVASFEEENRQLLRLT